MQAQDQGSKDNVARPFFSVVVPCCDVEPYVRECLDSLLGQDFADWEALVCVEESKDRTEEIVREYAARDARFKVFAGPRTGSCSVPRNRGIEESTGEYVIFLDGDDTIAEGSLLRLHDKIAAKPGADIYPCALRKYDDATKETLALRDNFPPDAPEEMTGPEATLVAARHPNGKGPLSPMLQLAVFRRNFLAGHAVLRCVPGLRREDNEFSPRALYLAKRVVPLHDLYYLYRIRPGSVCTSARGQAGYFLGDWAIVLKSLFAFGGAAARSSLSAVEARVMTHWGRRWASHVFWYWFAPASVRSVPRKRRLDTLETLFADGFSDFDAMLAHTDRARRLAGRFVRAYVRYPAARLPAELFFRAYFTLAERKTRRAAGKGKGKTP